MCDGTGCMTIRKPGDQTEGQSSYVRYALFVALPCALSSTFLPLLRTSWPYTTYIFPVALSVENNTS